LADVKISGLPASTTPLAGTEVLPIVQGGQTRQVSVANLTAGRAVSASNLTLTGVATVPAGTVSAPSITTTGDTNTGIFFPAADTIAFTEGGAEAMRINSSGNVGIKTTTPGSQLEIYTAFGSTVSNATNPGSIIINAGAGGNTIANGLGIEFMTSSFGAGYAHLISGVTASFGTALAFGVRGNSAAWTEQMRLSFTGGLSIGNITDPGAGGLRVSGLMYPQQATTAGAPAYVKGAIYFDTTLNKLRVGGATGWETITSV
jgi:hypothetical protein